MDGESIPMNDHLKARGINGSATSRNEHVPEAERQIRVIKERVRGIYNILLYSTIPKIMMRELVYYVVAWLNNFPPKGGVSKTISPRQMFTGEKIDFNKHCKLQFGEYVQVHEENLPTNSMTPRATGAIALGSNYNLKAGYKFLSLNTGKLITRRSFTPVPLTQDVKARVEQLGISDNIPNKLLFHDRNMEESLEDDDADTNTTMSEDDATIAVVDDEENLEEEDNHENDHPQFIEDDEDSENEDDESEDEEDIE